MPAVPQPIGNDHPSGSLESPNLHPSGIFRTKNPDNILQSINSTHYSTVQQQQGNTHPSHFHPSGSAESQSFIPPETLLLPSVLHQLESSYLDSSTDSSNTMSNPSRDLHSLGTL